ncbi:MAG: phage antirepressor KilAC domain-containing protein [Negativicutes bacterium]
MQTQMKTQQSLERIFHYQDQCIRALIQDGEPWFVAADVCAILGLVNPSQAVAYLDDDERCLISNEAWRNNGGMQAVSEAGLYSLVLRSRRAEAKNFRRWITHEVIPAIRRTGAYQIAEAAPATPSGQLLQFSRRDLLNLAMEAETECDQLRGVVTDLLPKAEFYDRVADTTETFSLGETAKMLAINGFGRNNLIHFLRSQGVLMADNVAKQRYIERGYFQVVQREYYAPDGTLHVKVVTRVYEKGIDYIRRLLDAYLLSFVEKQNTGY